MLSSCPQILLCPWIKHNLAWTEQLDESALRGYKVAAGTGNHYLGERSLSYELVLNQYSSLGLIHCGGMLEECNIKRRLLSWPLILFNDPKGLRHRNYRSRFGDAFSWNHTISSELVIDTVGFSQVWRHDSLAPSSLGVLSPKSTALGCPDNTVPVEDFVLAVRKEWNKPSSFPSLLTTY